MKSNTPTKFFLYLILFCHAPTYICGQGLLGMFKDFAAVNGDTPAAGSDTGSTFPGDDTFPFDNPFPADTAFPPDSSFPDNPFPPDNSLPSNSPTTTTTRRPTTARPTTTTTTRRPTTARPTTTTTTRRPTTARPTTTTSTTTARTTTTRSTTTTTKPTTVDNRIVTSMTSVSSVSLFLPRIPFGSRIFELISGITNTMGSDSNLLQGTRTENQPFNTPEQAEVVVQSTAAPVPVFNPGRPGTPIRAGRPFNMFPAQQSTTRKPATTSTTTQRPTTTPMRLTRRSTSTTTTVRPTSTTTAFFPRRQEPGGVALGAGPSAPVNLRPVANPGRALGTARRPGWQSTPQSVPRASIQQQSLEPKPALGIDQGNETYKLLAGISLKNFGRNRDLMRQLRNMRRGNGRQRRG